MPGGVNTRFRKYLHATSPAPAPPQHIYTYPWIYIQNIVIDI